MCRAHAADRGSSLEVIGAIEGQTVVLKR